MFGCRWLLLGFLASFALTSHLALAAPHDDESIDDWLGPNDIDYYDTITEDELTEDDLNALADEIAEQVQFDEGKLHFYWIFHYYINKLFYYDGIFNNISF